MKQINFAPPSHHPSSVHGARRLSLWIIGSVAWIICLSAYDLMFISNRPSEYSQQQTNDPAHLSYLRESQRIELLHEVEKLLAQRSHLLAMQHLLPIIEQYGARLNRLTSTSDQTEFAIGIVNLDSLDPMVKQLSTLNNVGTIVVRQLRHQPLEGGYELLLASRKKTTDSIKKS